jgi:hypothetical protein
MNVSDLVTDALRIAGLIAETESASAEAGADAVTRLNDMMAEWAGLGIDLGWNPKATSAETADIPAEHVDAIKASLALRLSASYGSTPDVTVAGRAVDGYNRLLRQALLGQIEPTRTGLTGTGNRVRWDISRG